MSTDIPHRKKKHDIRLFRPIFININIGLHHERTHTLPYTCYHANRCYRSKRFDKRNFNESLMIIENSYGERTVRPRNLPCNGYDYGRGLGFCNWCKWTKPLETRNDPSDSFYNKNIIVQCIRLIATYIIITAVEYVFAVYFTWY